MLLGSPQLCQCLVRSASVCSLRVLQLSNIWLEVEQQQRAGQVQMQVTQQAPPAMDELLAVLVLLGDVSTACDLSLADVAGMRLVQVLQASAGMPVHALKDRLACCCLKLMAAAASGTGRQASAAAMYACCVAGDLKVSCQVPYMQERASACDAP